MTAQAEAASFAQEESDAASFPFRFTFENRSGDTAWIERLRLASCLAISDPDWVGKWRRCEIVTIWGNGTKATDPDPEKHRQYCEAIALGMRREMPWLPCLLDSAGATLYIGPGFCSFSLPGVEGYLHIPQLLHYTEFLPWVTPVDELSQH